MPGRRAWRTAEATGEGGSRAWSGCEGPSRESVRGGPGAQGAATGRVDALCKPSYMLRRTRPMRRHVDCSHTGGRVLLSALRRCPFGRYVGLIWLATLGVGRRPHSWPEKSSEGST